MAQIVHMRFTKQKQNSIVSINNQIIKLWKKMF